MTSATPVSRMPSAASAGSRPPSMRSARALPASRSVGPLQILGAPLQRPQRQPALQRPRRQGAPALPRLQRARPQLRPAHPGRHRRLRPDRDPDRAMKRLLLILGLIAAVPRLSGRRRGRVRQPHLPGGALQRLRPRQGLRAPGRRRQGRDDHRPRRDTAEDRARHLRGRLRLPRVQGGRQLLLGAAVADRRVLPGLRARHLAPAAHRADPRGPQQDHGPARPGAEHAARAVQGPPPAPHQRVRDRARRQRREPERCDPLRRSRPAAAQAGAQHPRQPEHDDRASSTPTPTRSSPSSPTGARTSSTSSTTPAAPPRSRPSAATTSPRTSICSTTSSPSCSRRCPSSASWPTHQTPLLTDLHAAAPGLNKLAKNLPAFNNGTQQSLTSLGEPPTSARPPSRTARTRSPRSTRPAPRPTPPPTRSRSSWRASPIRRTRSRRTPAPAGTSASSPARRTGASSSSTRSWA